jgi:hypothetical protein
VVFVQVIQGQVSDTEAVHRAVDRWVADLARGSAGWLGATAGVTDDGRFIALARFESEEAALGSGDRPEHDAWWDEFAKLFSAEPSVRNSEFVVIDTPGRPEDAGFVQVIQGRGSDPARAQELMSQNSDTWAAFRPDVLGSVAAGHEGGAYTMALYFTSEAEAREGERKEPPPELRAQMAEMDKLNIGVPEFFDIRQPWLYSPR